MMAHERGPDADALALAPFVARDYHGGQYTAMYALASSGTYVSGLAREAEAAARLAEQLALAATDPDEADELATELEALHALAIDAARWEAGSTDDAPTITEGS